ncbi:MAG: ddlA [Gammaproteobacteria bacterium]|jgi:D-alanine-D-alanine ligase|nr:ddlA [Gammaproteobacteria bacterium]
MEKLKVAVFYGGKSPEHQISVKSARSIINHLDREFFEAVPIFVDKQGQLEFNAQNWKAKFDIAFPVIHGAQGEDGAIQGFFEFNGIPYVGNSVLGSAIAFDKVIAKRLALNEGIAVTPYLVMLKHNWENQFEEWHHRIQKSLGYPVVIKPATQGSSIGVSWVDSENELLHAIELAFSYSDKVLIEKAIDKREISIAVLEQPNQLSPFTSMPGEIISSHKFLTYQAKYLIDEAYQIVIPADLTHQQIEEAKLIALKVFECLSCRSMLRVDLFLDKHSGEFLFNEGNTMPGFSENSFYPKLLIASGVKYKDLLTQVIQSAYAMKPMMS